MGTAKSPLFVFLVYRTVCSGGRGGGGRETLIVRGKNKYFVKVVEGAVRVALNPSTWFNNLHPIEHFEGYYSSLLFLLLPSHMFLSASLPLSLSSPLFFFFFFWLFDGEVSVAPNTHNSDESPKKSGVSNLISKLFSKFTLSYRTPKIGNIPSLG